MMKQSKKMMGFTLLEILIALFIFSILSLMMASGLHNIINFQSRVESKAQDLRELQFTLLLMSLDLEQAVNRPIYNADGKEEAAFLGTESSFSLTHLGYAKATGNLLANDLQRSGYFLTGQTLSRITWPVLDQAPTTVSESRVILHNVEAIAFEYLAPDGRFYKVWPPATNSNVGALPRAVRVYLSLGVRGKMSQLYLIPAQQTNNATDPKLST